MNQHTMLNYVLANKKKKELEAQGITVPSDFMTKSLMYGMVAPNIPMLGYIIIDKEAKKLLVSEATLATETGNPPYPPLIKITAVDQNGNKLNRVLFISLPGKIEGDFECILKEKQFDTATTDENGVANLFYPKESDITIISFANKRLSTLQFEAGKVPETLEFLIETIPELIDTVSDTLDTVKDQKVGTSFKKSNNSK